MDLSSFISKLKGLSKNRFIDKRTRFAAVLSVGDQKRYRLRPKSLAGLMEAQSMTSGTTRTDRGQSILTDKVKDLSDRTIAPRF